jgi:hypothetical protein
MVGRVVASRRRVVQSVPQIARQVEKKKTLEERVQEIADREEIEELTAKYAHWVALGEGAKVARLFTGDGVSNRAEERIHQISWAWQRLYRS